MVIMKVMNSFVQCVIVKLNNKWEWKSVDISCVMSATKHIWLLLYRQARIVSSPHVPTKVVS